MAENGRRLSDARLLDALSVEALVSCAAPGDVMTICRRSPRECSGRTRCSDCLTVEVDWGVRPEALLAHVRQALLHR